MTSRTEPPPTSHARTRRAERDRERPAQAAPSAGDPQHLRVAGRRHSPLALAVALGTAAVVLVLAVLGGEDGAPQSSRAASAATRTLPAPVDSSAPGEFSRATSADQLRSAVVTALSEHLVLTDRLARAGLRREQDLADSADVALRRSSRTWQAALSNLGPDAARRGEQASTGSLTAVFAYAAARAEDDEAAARDARARVTSEMRGLSAVLVEAAGGSLDAGTTERGLQQYADGLVRQVDACDREDFVEAYEEERRTYAYSAHLGTVLADGLSTGLGLPGSDLTPADRQRRYLERLLAEHAALALDVVAAHLRAGPDAPASAAALKANGTELAWAVGQGRDAVMTGFSGLWQRRVQALVTYSGALAADEQGAARDALADVGQTSRQIVDLLEAGAAASPGTLLPSLQQQDQLLARQAADLAAADAPAAQRAFGEALDHGRELGSRVAETLTGRAAAGAS